MSRAAPARWKIVVAGILVVAIGVLAFVSYGGIGNGTPTERVTAWVKGSNLGSSIGTVEGDLSLMGIALGRHKSPGVLHTVCGVLTTDAQSANTELPSPDSTLTDLLSSAYALAYDAGSDCYASGGTDVGLVRKATRERIQAEARLGQARNLVAELTGRPLSTTTTTQPGGGGLFG